MAKKLVIQNHHLIYENAEHKQKEVTAKIFRGEHWVISQLNRRKNISRGFIQSLDLWLLLNRDKARDLNET